MTGMSKMAMIPGGELSIDLSQIAPVHLELESARAHDVVGPYGAFVATMAPAADQAPLTWGSPPYSHAGSRPPAPSEPSTGATSSALDSLAVVPVGIWKRFALYGFLFFVFGNLLRCGGLSTFTNVSCTLVVALGLVGVVVSAQRSP